MDQKIYANKVKPLIFKKRSKKSKRKREISEDEKNISDLFKRMKLENETDADNQTLERKNTSLDIFQIKSSTPIIPCKQSRSNCLRYLSFDKYLKDNMLDTSKISLSPINRQNNRNCNRKCIFEKKMEYNMPTFSNVVKQCYAFEREDGLDTLNKGAFCQKQAKSFICSNNKGNKIKRSSITEISEFKVFLPSFDQNREISVKNLSLSIINTFNTYSLESHSSYSEVRSLNHNGTSNFTKIFYSTIVTSKAESLFSSLSDDSSRYVTDCEEKQINELKVADKKDPSTNFCGTPKCQTPIENLGMSSKISATIIDLFWLELKIKRCKSLLSKFDIKSEAYEGFKKLRLKSAKLIKTYKILMDRKSKSNIMRKRKKKRARMRKALKSRGNDCISSLSTVYEPNEETILEAAETEKGKSSKSKRNCKRKKHDKESDTQEPKRSKLLDECIMRASTSKLFPVKKAATPTIKEVETIRTIPLSDDQMSAKDNSDDFVEVAESVNSSEDIFDTKPSFMDPVDKDISKILSQLPPLENTGNCTEIFKKNSIEISPRETLHYDIGNGKIMVILPYITY